MSLKYEPASVPQVNAANIPPALRWLTRASCVNYACKALADCLVCAEFAPDCLIYAEFAPDCLMCRIIGR